MKIVRSGSWLYDDAVRQPVDIVALDFDFWHEVGSADGQLEPGEKPQSLGDEGFLYYVRFKHAGDRTTPTWVDGSGHRSLADAVADAERAAASPLRWNP